MAGAAFGEKGSAFLDLANNNAVEVLLQKFSGDMLKYFELQQFLYFNRSTTF